MSPNETQNNIPGSPQWETERQKEQAEFNEILAKHPATIKCKDHGLNRQVDRRESWIASKVIYGGCPLCKGGAEYEMRARMREAGVPRNLCSATLENWIPNGEVESNHLKQIREFIQIRRGDLFLLGDLGTGKTHLAAAITREFRNFYFIKQSELLRVLRRTYRDNTVRDPVEHAQRAGLFVLDEIGVSGGGTDELPMIHDILDYRYNERKPTVLTGNITFDQVQGFLGERMADRLRECTFAVLMFGGASRRKTSRKKYFEETH